MAKSAAAFRKAAETFKTKGDRHYARGCAAAKGGDQDTANKEHSLLLVRF